MEIEEKQGIYVLKSDYEKALAERATIFRQDLESMARAKSHDIVSIAGGDPEKVPDVIDYILKLVYKFLERYVEWMMEYIIDIDILFEGEIFKTEQEFLESESFKSALKNERNKIREVEKIGTIELSVILDFKRINDKLVYVPRFTYSKCS